MISTRVAGWSMRMLLTILLFGPTGAARGACRSTCTEELRACRSRCSSTKEDRRACIRGCQNASTCTAPGSRLRLGAIVVNDCTTDAAGLTTFKQKLIARRGNCDFVTIMELPAVGPLPDPLLPILGVGVCRLFGDFRTGSGSFLFGRFQRLTALPDASGLIFEVTSRLSSLPPMTPALPEEGIYFARPDGTGLRRLGDASRVFVSRAIPDRDSPALISFVSEDRGVFSSSPDGKLIAFVDMVPDASGVPVQQVFVMDVESTERTQVTDLAAPSSGYPGACCAGFTDDRTIVFALDRRRGQRARVKVDGSGFEVLSTDFVPGGAVQPQFGVLGSAFARLLSVDLPRIVPLKTFPGNDIVKEVFFLRGPQLLQVTKFRQPDTGAFAFGGGRIFVASSADPDPIRRNPTQTCQLFSYDLLAGHLRQLTNFRDEGRPNLGCVGGAPGAMCTFSGGGSQDAQTGLVAFGSQCDPFGRNPYGEQVFSMRPDGTGLRQITAFRGRELLPDGGVHVELQGPIVQAVRY